MTMVAIYVCAELRKSVPCLSFYCKPNTLLGPAFRCKVECVQFHKAPLKNVFQASNSALFSRGSSIETVLAIDEFSNKTDYSHLSMDSALEQLQTEKICADNYEEYQLQNNSGCLHEAVDSCSSSLTTASIPDKEIQRRKKIGLANKGKTPWNKGITHSKETRERIKLRTIEALSDPKVRRKMSGFPRSHSDHSRASISFSLRKVWEERLKYRRLQENCHMMWAGSIAEAARKGFAGQEEMEWDSYEKIKSDSLAKYFQLKAEKARVKENAKVKAEIAAKVRAENAAKHAQKALEKEERAKAREMKTLARKKSENEKIKMALSKGLKLKARLTKHRKKQLGDSIVTQREIAVETMAITENMDIELIKKQKKQRRVSLAEQIRIAKNQKTNSHRDEAQLDAHSTPIMHSRHGYQT